MPVIPFRELIHRLAPSFLREGTGERFLAVIGTMVDLRMAKVNQGTKAHMPMVRNPNDRSLVLWVPSTDSLAAQGDNMGIGRGLTESDFSYASRLQRALDSWRYAGTARGIMGQILGYLLALTPAIRVVWTQYDRTTFPPTRVSSTWQSYSAGRDPNIEPENVDALAGGAGDFEWDDLSPITGSMGTWSSYVVIFSVAPNAWAQPAQAWGAGSTYTGSGDYSTISGDGYAATGTYSGTPQAWGAGSTYNGSGVYSTVSGDGYAPTGNYTGAAQAWGLSLSTDYGRSIQTMVKTFKPALSWVRAVIVCFDSALFSPTQPADGTHNPDGRFGTWSKVSGDGYAPSRFGNAVYGGEVI